MTAHRMKSLLKWGEKQLFFASCIEPTLAKEPFILDQHVIPDVEIVQLESSKVSPRCYTPPSCRYNCIAMGTVMEKTIGHGHVLWSLQSDSSNRMLMLFYWIMFLGMPWHLVFRLWIGN